MKRYSRCIFSFVYLFVCFHCSYGQAGPAGIADSLRGELNKTQNADLKFKLLQALIEQTSCSDSNRKLAYIEEYATMAEKMKLQEYYLKSLQLRGDYCSDCKRNYSKMIFWYDSCIRRSVELGNSKMESSALLNLGYTYFFSLSDFGKALDCYKKNMKLDTGQDNLKMTNGMLGQIYHEMGDYPKAAGCYEAAYDIESAQLAASKKTTNGDTMEIMGLLITMADLDVSMGQVEKAIKKYELIREFNQHEGNAYIDMFVYIGFGKCFSVEKKYDEAIRNYSSALEAGKKSNDEMNVSLIINELGNAYLEKGDLSRAAEYAEQGISAARGDASRAYFLPDSYLLMGKIESQKKDFRASLDFIKKAIDLYHATGKTDKESAAWKQLSNTYSEMHIEGEAFNAYKRYISLRDSIFSQDKAREITSLELQGDFNRKELADSLEQAKKDVSISLHLQRQRGLIYGGFAGIAALLLLAFIIFRGYSRARNANITIRKANETIKREKQVSETLLLNILPEEVADELKQHGKVKAKLFENVTVLFTDFVNFTSKGELLSPEELVEELHVCFKAFDEIIGKYKIEKIKTVGDAYLAVSGLPDAHAGHASEIIKAALEIRDFMTARQALMGDLTFGIRLGVHTGKVVAGIVGVKKFAYDIWGDTVNTASRMEQSSEPGQINISYDTYKLVKDDFKFTYRGEIVAKHKGKLKMYFVG